MGGKLKGKGLYAEELAKFLLEHLGYQIKKSKHKIIIDGNEIAEIDLIATSPNGETYAVEVKRGYISVNDVRQAYMNAKLIQFKPMIIARGFSNEAACTLAKELGVKVILFPELITIDIDDIKRLTEDLVIDTLLKFLQPPKILNDLDYVVLKCLAFSSNVNEFKERLKSQGVNESISSIFRRLRERDIIADHKNFKAIRLRSIILLLYKRLGLISLED